MGQWPWNVLQIEKTKDQQVIRHAYAKLCKQHHPEEHPEEFMHLQEAYQAALRYAKTKGARRSDTQLPHSHAISVTASPTSGNEAPDPDRSEQVINDHTAHKQEQAEKSKRTSAESSYFDLYEEALDEYHAACDQKQAEEINRTMETVKEILASRLEHRSDIRKYITQSNIQAMLHLPAFRKQLSQFLSSAEHLKLALLQELRRMERIEGYQKEDHEPEEDVFAVIHARYNELAHEIHLSYERKLRIFLILICITGPILSMLQLDLGRFLASLLFWIIAWFLAIGTAHTSIENHNAYLLTVYTLLYAVPLAVYAQSPYVLLGIFDLVVIINAIRIILRDDMIYSKRLSLLFCGIFLIISLSISLLLRWWIG